MSDLLTVSEVADVLRVDNTTVRRWIKQGALEAIILPHVRDRQAYRVRKSTLENLLTTPAAQPQSEQDTSLDNQPIPRHFVRSSK